MKIGIALAFDAGMFGLLSWTLGLVRRDRLYVGYGVLALAFQWVLVILVTAVVGLDLITLPRTPVMIVLLTSMLIAMHVLIYVLSQLTILANRVNRLVQEIALQRLLGKRDRPTDFESPV